MAQNLTVTHVRDAFVGVKHEARMAGVDTSLWTLIEGSSTYGNTWAIVNRDPENGGQSMVRVFGFTRSDAYEGMRNMTEAFRLVRTASQP